MKRYDREFLLSFADKECCKQRPEALESSLWRDSPSPDIVEGGAGAGAGVAAAAAVTTKFGVRREREHQQELPEWRNRANANGGGGLLPRRRPFDEDAPPFGNRTWGGDGNGNLARNQPERHRWENRGGRGTEAEPVLRPAGGRAPAEHDGLLGSGMGLRGPGPMNGGRTSDRYNAAGRGCRQNDSRFSKPCRGEDTFNGETFGDKDSDEHRDEEERKRRESFEQERREQQRLKEEKLRQGPAEKSSTTGGGVDALLEPVKISTQSEARHETEPAPVTPVAAPRPLVPPGFSQSALHKAKRESKEQEHIKVEESVDKPVVLESNGCVHENLVDPLAIACSGMAISDAECSLGYTDSSTWRTSPYAKSQFHGFETNASESKLAHLFEREDGPIKSNSPETTSTSYQGRMLPMPTGPSLEDIEKSMDHGNETRRFLTCEDIEQSLLGSKGPEVHNASEDGKSDSGQHLLSLLQKGSAKQRNEADHFTSLEVPAAAPAAPDKEAAAAPTLLESLFGSSFMMELRSTDAPLSAKVAAESNYIDSAQRMANGAKVEPIDKASGPKLMEAAPQVQQSDGLDVKDFLKYKRSAQRNKGNEYFDGVIDPSIEFVALKSLATEHNIAASDTRAMNGTAVPPFLRSHSPKPIQVQQILAMQASSKQSPSPAQVQQLLALQGTSKVPAFQFPPGMFPGVRSAAPANGRSHQQQQQHQQHYPYQQQHSYHHHHQQQQQQQQHQQAYGHFVPQNFPQYEQHQHVYEKQQQQHVYEKQQHQHLLMKQRLQHGSILQMQQQEGDVAGHAPSVSGYGGQFPSGYMGYPGAEAGDRAAAAQAMMQQPQRFGMNKLGFP